jgi:2-oxo-4-hydroxy-4-carboxy-5-ureidoimidazoline decarboxylase
LITQAARRSLAALNSLDVDAFTALLGGVFEHSPWVARAAYVARPFGSVAELHAAMVRAVANASSERQLRLLLAHPELARPGKLTAASATEQGGMGLNRLAADEAVVFDALNSTYRACFGFPFIIAVRGQRDRDAILAALEARVRNSPEQELATALGEVAKIARFRLDDLISEDIDAG